MKNLSSLVLALVFVSFLGCKEGKKDAGPAVTETKEEMPALMKS